MAAVGAGAVLRHGYLRKLKSMKRKYFALRGDGAAAGARLEYYESEKKFRAGAPPKRSIPLSGCFNIARRLDLKQRYVIALYTKEEQFCVVAEGEADLHSWLTDLLRAYQSHDNEELLHPTQHVWQVNVHKKGIGASRNIYGLYNLCLTDKSLTLVKVRPSSAPLADGGATEGIEFSLNNIRRCGDSECFFYVEVGRQTATGAGELWMHTDDANIAQSMHTTIYHAMCNCKEGLPPMLRTRSSSATEDPRGGRRGGPVSGGPMPAGAPDRRALASLNEKDKCVGSSCVKQCVCAYSVGESAATVAPLSPINASDAALGALLTGSLAGPLAGSLAGSLTGSIAGSLAGGGGVRVWHARTRSAPLAGDEPAARRASTGARLAKLSPAHAKLYGGERAPTAEGAAGRCRSDSMPSRACPPLDAERAPSRHPSDHFDVELMKESDAELAAEWHRPPPPRIPEEPDYLDMSPMDLSSIIKRKASGGGDSELEDGYLPMASSGSHCSDHRFSEFHLEPATALIAEEARPPRCYSVGSRPRERPPPRSRAYSLGARALAAPPHAPHAPPPHAPRAPRSTDDLMELDFSRNSLKGTPPLTPALTPARTPPRAEERAPKLDEYVDMSPRDVTRDIARDMSRDIARDMARDIARDMARDVRLSPGVTPRAAAPDGYVEMSYGRAASKPIAIVTPPPPPPPPVAALPAPAPARRAPPRDPPAPAPAPADRAQPPPPRAPTPDHELQASDVFDEEVSPAAAAPAPTEAAAAAEPAPARCVSRPIAAPAKPAPDPPPGNPAAARAWAGQVTYASLDLEPRAAAALPAPRAYTQIDFALSERLNLHDVH